MLTQKVAVKYAEEARSRGNRKALAVHAMVPFVLLFGEAVVLPTAR